ncbi:hypothetical protein [Bacillus sp. Marseille-Q3570]|uniref:hypothetical protein n=1 Tax=Bacillus sp. Marseille-Q3570 TaxID=2963522 RepID=UPI0021B82A99|nr:hypothetical protein [Bacillus sp. Marseille-Q3570]
MQIVYGVEHRELRGHPPGFISQFVHKIASTANIVDRDDRLCIVQSESEYEALQALFKEDDLFEEAYALYPLQSPTTTFNKDYGFVSSSNHAYLYKEMAVPFRMDEGNGEQTKMAMLQLEEHIVALDDSVNPIIYFADRQQDDLVKQIASAYDVSVTLL